MQEQIFLNAINKTEVFLPQELKLLEALLGSFKDIWRESNRTVFRKAEVAEEKIERFFGMRGAIDPNREWAHVEKEGLQTITWHDEAYPSQLKNITDPPPILYMKGTLSLEAPIIAVVGTRKFSLYGKQVTQELSRELSQAGVTIASGLARGIDTFAHTACVEQENPTIAVIGSGIDEESLYPADNRGLAQKIVETGGVVMSEFSPGAEAWPSHFPQRNRIVAAIALGVIVVEAPIKSGAMITARLALEQGKEVFAVPGPINSINSEGTNYLIKQGAHPVTSAEDVIDVLKSQCSIFNFQSNANAQISKVKREELTEEEQKILEAIERENLHVDKIIEETNLPPKTVISALTLLEIKDAIKHIGNNVYAKKS